MANEAQIQQLEDRILDAIRSIRGRHGACTARSVAASLRLSPDVVRYRCQALKERNVVNWTDMPGSLHVVESIDDQLHSAKAELEAATGSHQCECGWPTEKALEMHRRKAH